VASFMAHRVGLRLCQLSIVFLSAATSAINVDDGKLILYENKDGTRRLIMLGYWSIPRCCRCQVYSQHVNA